MEADLENQQSSNFTTSRLRNLASLEHQLTLYNPLWICNIKVYHSSENGGEYIHCLFWKVYMLFTTTPAEMLRVSYCPPLRRLHCHRSVDSDFSWNMPYLFP